MIDVIIPCFNRASVLERAVNSVLTQTFQDFSLFIVDDGSSDDTQNILWTFKTHPKVTVLKQDNRGVSAARNLGVKNSNSPWISFLDSDDEWLPTKLEVQVKEIKKNPSTRFIHSNEIWIRNGVRVNAPEKFDKSNHDIFKRSLEFCLISPSTVILKRELFEERGHFDESFTVCEDYDLWLKILAREDVTFISDFLVKKYGGHADQLSTKFPAMDYWRIRSMIGLSRTLDLDPEKKKLICEEINRKAPVLLKGYLKHGQQDRFNEISELIKSV